jgi:hypothetical protein
MFYVTEDNVIKKGFPQGNKAGAEEIQVAPRYLGLQQQKCCAGLFTYNLLRSISSRGEIP